jgi:bifunctional DNA-binding transcriptional regulator/antitoxin component of YhaV-PrlF toxin-antitoxin module
MATVRIDDRYRITIPQEARAGLRPGDVLFVVREQRPEGPVWHAAKAINPLDALIELGREEERRGEEVPLAEFAREHGLDLAALEHQQEALAGLAEDASAEDRRGETVSLGDLIRSVGLDPDHLPDHLTTGQEQHLVEALAAAHG